MSYKKISFKGIHEQFCDFIDSCGKFCCYTRSIDIQQQKITECEDYLITIKEYKSHAITRKDEGVANQFFHMQCVINSLRSFLLVWKNLKENDFNKSWTYLIDAQEYLIIALKIDDYEGIRNLETRLNSAETLLFPGWAKYISAGFTETIGKCSICYELFSKCEHIENSIYMGKLCLRVDREIKSADHVALVDNPRDKRCIITKISDDDGNEIDYFSWKGTGRKIDSKEGHHMEAILFCKPTLDVF